MQDIFTTAKTSTWQHKTLIWAAYSPLAAAWMYMILSILS